MRHVKTINVVDAGTNDEGSIIIRNGDSIIGIAVSLRADGDTEIFVTREVAEQIIGAIQSAFTNTP
jgi:hypothetical protein